MDFYTSSYGSQSNASHGDPLQFYGNGASSGFYGSATSASRSGLDGHVGASTVTGSIGSTGAATGYSAAGPIVVRNWWNAFTPWTGMEGEPPLLQELGINFDHILQKSLTVMNPVSKVEPHIMDDADLAGPLVFCFIFAMLLLVSGKPQFSYIYGVALVGSVSIYTLLNLMSESGIDAYRTASVLGYCLLPLVMLAVLSVAISLDGAVGYVLSALAIAWCSYAASSIFAAVLRLSHQRFLVAYPLSLLYAMFALLSVFDATTGNVGVNKA